MNKRKKKVTYVLCALILISAVAITIGAGVKIHKDRSNTTTTEYVLTSTTEKVSTTADYGDGTDNSIQVANHPTKSETNASVTKTPIVTVKPKPDDKDDGSKYIEYYEELSPNGKNKLSDNQENEFICLVSEDYHIDKSLLVAIYSIPDTGTNFVLEFNGEKDSQGKVIKSPATLARVYQIDKAKNVKIATGGVTGNVGVSYPEAVLCFNMVKTIVMEQYPNYFTGLRK